MNENKQASKQTNKTPPTLTVLLKLKAHISKTATMHLSRWHLTAAPAPGCTVKSGGSTRRRKISVEIVKKSS